MTTVTITKVYPLKEDAQPFKPDGSDEAFFYLSGFLQMRGTDYHFTTKGCKPEYVDQDMARLKGFIGHAIEAKVELKDGETGNGTPKVKLAQWPNPGNDLKDLGPVEIVEGGEAPGSSYLSDGSGGVSSATPVPADGPPSRSSDTVAPGGRNGSEGGTEVQPAASSLPVLAQQAIEAMRAAAVALQAVVKASEGVGKPPEGEAGGPNPTPSDDPKTFLLQHYGSGSGVARAYASYFETDAKPVAEMTDEELIQLVAAVI